MNTENINQGFSKIYSHYENLNQESLIDKTMRQQVYNHINHYLQPASNILELNSGSGIDAVYFAQKGHHVIATDIADGSKMYIESKIAKLNLSNLSFEKCSFTDLKGFKNKQIDYVFSNFGGLNCTDELDKVIESLNGILQKNAMVTFVIMGKYYPWDWVYLLKGKIRRAFVRFKKNGTFANVKGEKIKTYYYTPKKIKNKMQKHFDFIDAENLGLFYPSVNHTSITKHTNIIKKLISIDIKINKKKVIPVGICDYYIITFKKK